MRLILRLRIMFLTKADYSELQADLTPVRVQKVIDPLTILAENGTLYKLSGIDIPENSDFALAAQKELTTLLAGSRHQTLSDENRGCRPHDAPWPDAGTDCASKRQLWIEGRLVAKGLARVRTTPANPEMAKQLLALEERSPGEQDRVMG